MLKDVTDRTWNLRITPWFRILYKQLVNLVNDNIKKDQLWILIISGFRGIGTVFTY
jgi:hypothetical protein